MFSNLLFFHSIVRWLLLISLLYALIRAYKGYTLNLVFSKTDNVFRHWTATIAHIQLMIGITLFTKSEIVKYFWKNFAEASQHLDTLFFGLIHILLMIISVVVLTVGSALAKRKLTDKDKFKTMFTYFLVALMIIFIGIPWPFSPLAQRPYFRNF